MTSEKEIGAFLDSFAFKLPIIKSAEQEIDRHLSRNHNVFKYIEPNEVMLSRIIGDLLDTNGDHGQRDLFFELFLENFIPQASRMDFAGHPKIFLEEITSSLGRNRRIDIVVYFKNGALIGIENKPWAEEQDRQLYDYNMDLKERSGNNYSLIYLMGSYFQKLPENAPENLIFAAYRKINLSDEAIVPSLESWILQCIDRCHSARFRQFLEEFLIYIQENFSLKEGGGEQYEP